MCDLPSSRTAPSAGDSYVFGCGRSALHAKLTEPPTLPDKIENNLPGACRTRAGTSGRRGSAPTARTPEAFKVFFKGFLGFYPWYSINILIVLEYSIV